MEETSRCRSLFSFSSLSISQVRDDSFCHCDDGIESSRFPQVSTDGFQSEEIKEIAARFAIDGTFLGAEEVKTGLINSTWIATFGESEHQSRYILQRINESVFGNPIEVMANIQKVTRHINNKVMRVKKDAGGQTLNLYPSRDGGAFAQGRGKGIWRCYNFIEGCRTYDVVANEQQAYQAGHAFGAFQDLVHDLPAASLTEVIPNFHNTPYRYRELRKAVALDEMCRAGGVSEELIIVDSFHHEMSRLVDLAGSSAVPLRVTHNDTKINNVLFDEENDEAVCVIDLDTVMPGLSLYDFGDLVRTATNPAVEDERDLSLVQVRLPIFEALVSGYLSAAGSVLTETEVSLLPFSGKLIALELGMRFLSDYLNGDKYFRTTRTGQNLDRARTQLRLAQCLDEAEDELQAIVMNASRS